MNMQTPANFAAISKNQNNSFQIGLDSNDSSLINTKLLYRLDFADPDLAIIPPLNPYFIITVKCIVKLVSQTNLLHMSFEYKVG